MEKNNNLHKIDQIFIVGIIVIAILSSVIDFFCWKDVEYGGFPVFSCISIFASYALWIVLLIYSFLKYKEKQDKPKYVRWYMYFILPFLHIAFILIGLILSIFVTNLFNL